MTADWLPLPENQALHVHASGRTASPLVLETVTTGEALQAAITKGLERGAVWFSIERIADVSAGDAA